VRAPPGNAVAAALAAAAPNADKVDDDDLVKAPPNIAPKNNLPGDTKNTPEAKQNRKRKSHGGNSSARFDTVGQLAQVCTNPEYCKKRGLFCASLVLDQDHQQQIRDTLKRKYEYDEWDVLHLNGGKSATDDFILSNMHDGPPPTFDNYKRDVRHKQSPCTECADVNHNMMGNAACTALAKERLKRMPGSCAYMAPPKRIKVAGEEIAERSLPICREVFGRIFKMKKDCIDTFNTARKNNEPLVRKIGSGSERGLSTAVKVQLKDIMTSHKRSLTHYAKADSGNNTTYYHDGDQSMAAWYMEWLKRHQTECYDQSKRLGYFHSYHEGKQAPSPAEYAADVAGAAIRPELSYSAAAAYYNGFDISFRTLQTDTCEYCFKKNWQARNAVVKAPPMELLAPRPDGSPHPDLANWDGAAEGELDREQAEIDLALHQERADTTMLQKSDDVKRVRDNPDGTEETVQFDPHAGKRTPFMTISASFFANIIVTTFNMFCVASTGKNYGMLFDETMLDKGANMTGSCLYKLVHDILLPKRPLDANGDATMTRLNLWCDGTAGQTW